MECSRASRAPQVSAQMLVLATALLLLGIVQQSGAQSSIATYQITSSTINGLDLSNYLAAAQANSAISGVQLSAAGTYQLDTSASSYGAAIRLLCTGASRTFTVNFSGTTFLLQSSSISGLLLAYCQNVVINGGTFYHVMNQRPVAQGTITNINTNNGYWTVQIHADFLASFQRMQNQYGNGQTFGINTYDPTTLQIKTYAYGVALNAAAVLTPGTVQYQGGNTYYMQVGSVLPNVGDYFTYRQPDNTQMIVLFFSSSCTLQNIIIRQASLTAVVDLYGAGGNTYSGIQIAPDPTPGSDGHLQIGTAGGDGFGMGLSQKGPTIKNCVIQGTGDDSIDITGHFYTIVEVYTSSNSIVIANNAVVGNEVYPGDTINFYGYPTWQPLGTATVAAAPVSVPFPGNIPAGTTDQLLLSGPQFSTENTYQISLTNINVPSGFGNIPFNSIISNPSREMAGAQIISNTITSNRGRGVSLQSSNGVIANNTIVNMGPNQGISVGPNNQYGEAGFADNMLITGNTIKTLAGAIQVGGSGIYTSAALFNNITITNNVLYNVQQGPLTVWSANNVVVTGNQLIDPMCSGTNGATFNPALYATSVSQPFSFVNVSALNFQGNTITIDGNCAASQANLGAPVNCVNCANPVAIQTFPSSNTLYSGQTLPEYAKLFSPNGQFYLTIDTNGNINLYNYATGVSAWRTAYYPGYSGAPYSLKLQSNCDVQEFNNVGQLVWDFYNAGRGAAPCTLQVTNAGTVVVVDSAGVTWSLNGKPVAPGLNSGVILVGQTLQQTTQLFSADGSVFLYVTYDGNVQLYNTASYNQYGLNSAGAIIWQSKTGGNSPQPFQLVMQDDCNLVLYNGNYNTNGPAFAYAVFSTLTYGQGTGFCHALVTSANGGSLQVVDSTGRVFYQQPASGAAAPASADTLPAGQSLTQGTKLYSQSGQYYLVPQSDGNLILYNSYLTGYASVIYASNTYGTNPGPFTLTALPAPACAVNLLDGNGRVMVSFNTSGEGVAPCHIQVLNSGKFALEDALNVIWSLNGVQSVPVTNSGVMSVGQTLVTGQTVTSASGAYFLSPQATGELALFNTAQYAIYGPSPLATVWRSQTSSLNSPFQLVLQEDCNFVMYDNTLPARGPSYYDAVYATGTSGRSALGGLDAGCQVYIQDGLFRIVDSRGNTIFNTYGSVIPVADTLNYGSSLHQGQSLYSQNGLYYLELQPDGNIVTRTAQGNNLVFSANSYQSNPTSLFPFTLAVQSNCDVTETTNTGATIYSFNNARKGVSPCRLQIRNDGSLAIFDSLNNLLSVNAQPARPVASSGQILTGQAAQDGLAIYSPDGTAYLVALYTGRLVLINTARALLDPGLYQSGTIIWSSGTSGGPDPLSLVMQEDCNLVLYNGNYITGGPSAAYAIYNTGTGGQGSQCRVTVNNGYTWSIVNSAGQTVFQRP